MHQFLSDMAALVRELAPWASVAVASIAAWQSKRAKEVGKLNADKLEAAEQRQAETHEKLKEVSEAVNGRVEQLVANAKQEGYEQAKKEVSG